MTLQRGIASTLLQSNTGNHTLAFLHTNEGFSERGGGGTHGRWATRACSALAAVMAPNL